MPSVYAAEVGGPADFMWRADMGPLYETWDSVLPPLFRTAIEACRHYYPKNKDVKEQGPGIVYDPPYGFMPQFSYRELGYANCNSESTVIDSWGGKVRKEYICPLTSAGSSPYFSEPIPGQSRIYAKVTCPTPYVNPQKKQLEITVTSPTETRPAGTGGSSDLKLTAKVTQGNNAKPGVAVSFSASVLPNSGGHEHDDPYRPKGIVDPVNGTTDSNGEIMVKFKAPEVAGIHTIKATCATCSNSPATKEIQVKVPDLLPISPNAPQNTDGTFVYALTSVDKTHQGNGRYHLNQYYLTQQSQINLQSMVKAFAKEGWGTVALNDASLFWGGRYDITANWGAPHAAHRDGREIDISFTRAQNPVSAVKQKIFYKKFCEAKTVQVPFSILHHYVLVPHFHVFLEKQTACFKSEH